MRTTGRMGVVVVLMGLMLTWAPAALWADSAIPPGTNIFGVNPNANGTKVVGPLEIYYRVVSTTACGSSNHLVDMYYVMRLKVGTNSFAFAPAGPASLCYENTDAQKTEIEGFITNVVIPLLFQLSGPAPRCSNANVTPCWDLKTVTEFHQDGELQPCVLDTTTQDCASFWAAMDITLAVRP